MQMGKKFATNWELYWVSHCVCMCVFEKLIFRSTDWWLCPLKVTDVDKGLPFWMARGATDLVYFQLAVSFFYSQVVCQTVMIIVFHSGVEMTAVMSYKNSPLSQNIVCKVDVFSMLMQTKKPLSKSE